ncbi:hypothetical protein ACLI09_11700 [Flavobacterium sp. RHBU_24]|uniref:hypothetical protein n=1 Tax=Flavobacterium sp. RHBU_24 TaxID=3391185 RepID=UPI003984B3A4
MDELDKLKSHWKNSQETYPQVSESDIYAMLHKRSSSIVRWILIISIIELAFWAIGPVVSPYMSKDDLQLPRIVSVLDYINYTILGVFITLFYINYRKISAEKPVKELLRNIITVRRIVRAYMFYIIGTITFILIYTLFTDLNYNPDTDDVSVLLTGIVVVILMLLLAIFIYNILYGRLLRKLNKNYRELEKIQGK